jgi:hypothetical protein
MPEMHAHIFYTEKLLLLEAIYNLCSGKAITNYKAHIFIHKNEPRRAPTPTSISQKRPTFSTT